MLKKVSYLWGLYEVTMHSLIGLTRGTILQERYAVSKQTVPAAITISRNALFASPTLDGTARTKDE